MTQVSLAEPAAPPARNPFDDWRSIVIALYMTLAGYAVMVGIPVISTAWVELLGFTEEQVGRVAGADLGGLALGSVLASLVVKRWNRHHIAYLGVAIAVLANGLCMHYVSYEQVLWLRALGGTGAGIFTAVAIATLGGTSKPARAYNLMLFAFAFSQAAEMQVLPMLSMNGIYWAFIGSFLVSLPFIRFIPTGPHPVVAGAAHAVREDGGERAAGPAAPHYLAWLTLTAIFFTYVNIGTYWTYIELAALDAALDGEWVGRLLVIVSIGSVVGCLVATVISNRFGLAKPLLATLAVMAAIVGALAPGITYANLLVSLALFNFLWIFIDVYQLGTVAVLDRKGTFAALTPCAAGLGQMIGPFTAASLLGSGMGYGSIFTLCAACALVAMLIYGFMYVRVRAQVPELVSQKQREAQPAPS
ncbi:MAG: MFS transporter [Pseudomonadota bacterium]